MSVKERFLRYVAVDSGSSDTSGTHPSTQKQWDMARLLERELLQMGAQDVRVSPACYVYATIPANVEHQPAIGLIAHMDTSSSVATGPVNARCVQYAGGDLEVGHGAVMRFAQYESLARHIGHELIVTDGATLLGGDDKAGVAEIMAACDILLNDPSIRHGKVCVGFTPDEEIGEGADLFDIAGFGADFAYTVDGGRAGELECENFNACTAMVTVRGFNIHPGSAKNKMKNANRMAVEFAGMMPDSETPEHTEQREGFYHLSSILGDEVEAKLRYIIRDHDRAKFELRKERIQAVARYLNGKYGEGSFEVSLKDTYYNMKEIIDRHPEIVRRAMDAIRAAGDEPVLVPIRGGTDGARLSYAGLPCPNLPTGGYNMHGVLEYVSVPEMERVTRMLVELVRA
ncbi:MAG: peptidase T [Clostridiales bacterium]|nr:peptidase T [Clostridiales bacterium]